MTSEVAEPNVMVRPDQEDIQVRHDNLNYFRMASKKKIPFDKIVQ